MEEFKVPTLPPVVPKKSDKEIKNIENVQQPFVEVEEKSEDIKTAKTTSENVAACKCPYKLPSWSACPPSHIDYKFEVLKSGQIIEEVKSLQTRAYWKFGRFADNDIIMAHPTISRYHAVLQYKPNIVNSEDEDIENDNENKDVEGWYIYDLGSTHGTFLNKQRIPIATYIRMKVGHMLRMGASTRSYLLQGPAEDEEPESELSVTELRAQRQQREEERELELKRKIEEAAERERTEGVSWGMTEDADEETDLTHNPYASTNNEDLFLDDPKRTLRGYFEREGVDLEYKCDEMSTGTFVCRIELPIDDSNGRAIIAEVIHKGRKKECAVQCALEACRILDRHGVLRQSNQEPLKRKMKSQESDSDEDEFWDRTGDVERKKMRKANAGTSVTFTYEDLCKQEKDILAQQQQIADDITVYQEKQKRLKEIKAAEEQAADDLDNYMDNLCEKAEQLDKLEIRKLRMEQQRLRIEYQKLQKLLKIAKPADMHFNDSTEGDTKKTHLETAKRQLPMIGKRNQFSKFKIVRAPMPPKEPKNINSDEEEVEEAEDEVCQKATEEYSDNLHVKKKTEMLNDITSENSNNIFEKMQEEEADKKVNSDPIIEETNMNVKTMEEKVISSAPKLYGPVVISTEVLNEYNDEDRDAIVTDFSSTSALCKEEMNENEISNKKRRHRQRQRHKRHEVDVEELADHETADKYAKWVPPENQSGDGFTELNKKYGY